MNVIVQGSMAETLAPSFLHALWAWAATHADAQVHIRLDAPLLPAWQVRFILHALDPLLPNIHIEVPTDAP